MLSALPGSGLVTMDQVAPSQCSTRVWSGAPGAFEDPTAQTSDVEVPEIPSRKSTAGAVSRSGVGTMTNRFPLKCSASVRNSIAPPTTSQWYPATHTAPIVGAATEFRMKFWPDTVSAGTVVH